MKIRIITSYKLHKRIELEVIPDKYCQKDSTYLVTNPEDNMFDINRKIDKLEAEVAKYRASSENRLRGINYWKGRAKA